MRREKAGPLLVGRASPVECVGAKSIATAVEESSRATSTAQVAQYPCARKSHSELQQLVSARETATIGHVSFTSLLLVLGLGLSKKECWDRLGEI